jgi:hypothetical protein
MVLLGKIKLLFFFLIEAHNNYKKKSIFKNRLFTELFKKKP